VERIVMHGEQVFHQNHKFLNLSVISGSGRNDSHDIKKGDHFILPEGYGAYRLAGDLELIISHI
jgi:mannose-6-phosphate isomerase class I